MSQDSASIANRAAQLLSLTGKIAMAGVLNGLHWWSDQMTYASTSGTVVAYGQGMDAGDPWQFYETTIAQ